LRVIHKNPKDVMVEGNPKKPRVWLHVSQRKPKMMIDDDARGVKMFVTEDLLLNNVRAKVS
jgi:Mg2+ and Co2+ transporter CorA